MRLQAACRPPAAMPAHGVSSSAARCTGRGRKMASQGAAADAVHRAPQQAQPAMALSRPQLPPILAGARSQGGPGGQQQAGRGNLSRAVLDKHAPTAAATPTAAAGACTARRSASSSGSALQLGVLIVERGRKRNDGGAAEDGWEGFSCQQPPQRQLAGRAQPGACGQVGGGGWGFGQPTPTLMLPASARGPPHLGGNLAPRAAGRSGGA